jgi:hypothetical protein
MLRILSPAFVRITAIFCVSLYSSLSVAQLNLNNLNSLNVGDVHGNFQADAQYYVTDSNIGAYAPPQKMGLNGFANILYTKGKFTAGIRYESYLFALNGFDARHKGNGIPYRFAQYKSDILEVTVGNFYQQFGSGLLLRAYEERGLGFDNSLDGIRLKIEPVKGIRLTGLTGKQRLYFTQGPGLVRGFDGEMQINEVFKSLAEKKLNITLGGSFVSKFQEDDDAVYNLPENVGAYGGRFDLRRGGFTLYGEYDYKINDPQEGFKINTFRTFKPGQAILLQTSYSVKGFALSLSGSHIDNMTFRSDRNALKTDLLINYTPILSKQHTYSLLTFYPYASQSNGEVEFSSELNYKIKKETLLGGKYGTEITLNYSGANGLDTTLLPSTDTTFQMYETNSFGPGKSVYFRDFYVEISKKFTKKFKASVIYSYQEYNKDVIQGLSGYGTIYSNIAVVDMTYKLKSDMAVRLELQNLATAQDQQDWGYGLLEYTFNSNWFAAVGDLYNYGNDITDARYHFYNGTIGWTKDANRITLSYGKQRAGIFCVGGVCRLVPAASGVTLTVTSSF